MIDLFFQKIFFETHLIFLKEKHESYDFLSNVLLLLSVLLIPKGRNMTSLSSFFVLYFHNNQVYFFLLKEKNLAFYFSCYSYLN